MSDPFGVYRGGSMPSGGLMANGGAPNGYPPMNDPFCKKNFIFSLL